MRLRPPRGGHLTWWSVRRKDRPGWTFFSIFAISEALRACGAGTPVEVERLRSGDICVQVRGEMESRALLGTNVFGKLKVKVLAHRSLNSSKGVVKSADLENCSEAELCNHVNNVIRARRITIHRNSKDIKTNTWILTFDTPTPPPTIRVAWLDLRVLPYTPKPMRCFKCQRFGHTKTNCL